jgi:hypothetical protein
MDPPKQKGSSLLYFFVSFAHLNPGPGPDPADQNQCGSKSTALENNILKKELQ